MDLKAMKVSDSPGIVELQILLWREKWQRTRVTWNWYCMHGYFCYRGYSNVSYPISSTGHLYVNSRLHTSQMLEDGRCEI